VGQQFREKRENETDTAPQMTLKLQERSKKLGEQHPCELGTIFLS